MFELAKTLGDELIVIVNSDDFLMRKKGKVDTPLQGRVRLIKGLEIVDKVIVSIDKDSEVVETLRLIKPDIFVNGGDRVGFSMAEVALSGELGFKLVGGLGSKISSSRKGAL